MSLVKREITRFEIWKTLGRISHFFSQHSSLDFFLFLVVCWDLLGFFLTLCLVVEKTKGKKKKNAGKTNGIGKNWLSVGGGYNQILPHADGQVPPNWRTTLVYGVGVASRDEIYFSEWCPIPISIRKSILILIQTTF